MHAGDLKQAVEEQLNLHPVQGPVYCEEVTGIFHLGPDDQRTYISPSYLRLDDGLAGLKIASTFSFGNGVTISAIRDVNGQWTYAIWLVFTPEDREAVDGSYERLRDIVLSHRSSRFDHHSSELIGNEKFHHGKYWFLHRPLKEDMLLGQIGSDKHAHFIFKEKELKVGDSESNITPEVAVPGFKLKLVKVKMNRPVVAYTYTDAQAKSVATISEEGWPDSTSSNTPTNLGFMSIGVEVR